MNPSLLSRVSLLSLGGQRGREGQRKSEPTCPSSDIRWHVFFRVLVVDPQRLCDCLRRRRAGRAKVNEDAASGLTQVRNLPQDLPGATMLPLPI